MIVRKFAFDSSVSSKSNTSKFVTALARNLGSTLDRLFLLILRVLPLIKAVRIVTICHFVSSEPITFNSFGIFNALVNSSGSNPDRLFNAI